MADIKWDIRREGRAWGEEAMSRWQLTPEKFEMYKGKLFWSDEDRLNLLGLLLENVGVDAAVRLGDPEVWRAAIANLGRSGQVHYDCAAEPLVSSLTIKGLSDELYRRLKESAKKHHRSINREVLARLEHSFRRHSVDAEAMLARADAVRERLALPYLTDDALREAKGSGRS